MGMIQPKFTDEDWIKLFPMMKELRDEGSSFQNIACKIRDQTDFIFVPEYVGKKFRELNKRFANSDLAITKQNKSDINYASDLIDKIACLKEEKATSLSDINYYKKRISEINEELVELVDELKSVLDYEKQNIIEDVHKQNSEDDD